MNGRRVRCIVLDDQPPLRLGVVTLLGREPDIEVVGEGRPGDEGLALVRSLAPDVAVTDLLFDADDALAFVRDLRQAAPASRIVVLTAAAGADLIRRALGLGATGFLLKTGATALIPEAVRAAAAGATKLAEDVAARLARSIGRRQPPLTSRERDVLRRLALGESNREIAAALAISQATVKSHLLRLFEKLGVSGRLAAVTEALERGLVHAPAGRVRPAGSSGAPSGSPRTGARSRSGR
jgi:DNA-binding NarL/FixJ family response regulator